MNKLLHVQVRLQVRLALSPVLAVALGLISPPLSCGALLPTLS